MSFLHPSFLDAIPIPQEKMRTYYCLRGLLFVGFISVVSIISYSFLFPSKIFTIDFRNPDAVKNTLLDPRDASENPTSDGRIDEQTALIVNGGAIGIFADATLSVQLKKDSSIPKNTTLSIQKGYRELFLPEGDSAEFPAWKKDSLSPSGPFDGQKNANLFRIDGIIYQLFDGILYRFSSDAAALSRYEPTDITDETIDFLDRYPLSEEWIGFRPGTLLSFADGVFVVYSETDIRPIGSPLIFQAMGYNWDDVIPASEEEIGMYTRGKVIFTGTLRAPGTLFHDIERNTFFTIDEQKIRRPIRDTALLSFFLKRTHPISVSEKSREISSRCILTPGTFFSKTLSCDASLREMINLPGNDYQLTFTASSDMNIESISATLKRSPEKDNLLSTLSQLKIRITDRYAQ